MLSICVYLGVAANTDGIPSALTDKLTRGVNVTRWFCYEGATRPTKDQAAYWTTQDTVWLKRLGVNYVRLCVSPDYIYANGEPKPAELATVDAAVKRLGDAGFAIVWDLHDNGQMKLDTPGHDNSGFVKFWQKIAAHYKGKGYSNLVFELVNEPQFNKNAPVWHELQQKTVTAVRSIDPNRTIMVSGIGWGGIEGLEKLPILPEHNLVYSAHCYDPFQFTHQGASWTGPDQQNLRNLPFPSSPEAVAKIIDTIPAAQQGTAKWYGEQRYDRKYLLSRLSRVRDFGAKNRKFVLLGEFGAYPPVSPPVSRRQWFSDMSAVMTVLHLSNAIWGYDDALGLGRKLEKGTGKLDPDTLSAFYHVK